MNTENEKSRTSQLYDKLKEWKVNNEQDKHIVNTVRAQTFLAHNDMIETNHRVKEVTMYSGLNDKELFEKFQKATFNSLQKYNMTHLMQEVHNRTIKNFNYDVTRQVAIVGGCYEDSVFGAANYGTDSICVNENKIEKSKTISPKNGEINKNSVGIYFLDMILHETKHIVQFENSTDVVLGNKIDEESDFVGTCSLMSHINMFAANEDYETNYMDEWRRSYNERFMEHDANYFALKTVISTHSHKLENSKSFNSYLMNATKGALNFIPDKDEEERKFQIEARVLKVEDCLKKQLNYFKNSTKDCSMKDVIISKIENFLALDENRNSKFRDKMRKEISEMTEIYMAAKCNLESIESRQTFIDLFTSKFD